MARMNLRTASQRKPPAKFLETGFLVKPTAKSTSNGSASQASGPVRAERNNAAARISPASSALTSLPPSRAPTPPRSPNSTRLATLRQRPVRSSRTAAKTTRGNGNSPLKVQAAAQRARASSRDESEDQEDDDAGHEASRASGSRPMPFVLIEPGQINRQDRSTSAESRVSRLEKELFSLHKEVGELRTEQRASLAQATQPEQQIQRLIDAVESIGQELDGLKESLAGLEYRVDCEANSVSDQLASFHEQLATMEKRLSVMIKEDESDRTASSPGIIDEAMPDTVQAPTPSSRPSTAEPASYHTAT